MKLLIPLFLILLSGCTALPKYNYQSQASNDPVFIFGDRFGEGSISSPARSFTINIKDAASNKCADFESVGTTSNHWMRLNSPTIQIKTPAGKVVVIRGIYVFSSTAVSNKVPITICESSALAFLPKEGASYSVDVDTANNVCALSIVKKLPNGQLEKVEGLTVLPACQEQ